VESLFDKKSRLDFYTQMLSDDVKILTYPIHLDYHN